MDVLPGVRVSPTHNKQLLHKADLGCVLLRHSPSLSPALGFHSVEFLPAGIGGGLWGSRPHMPYSYSTNPRVLPKNCPCRNAPLLPHRYSTSYFRLEPYKTQKGLTPPLSHL